MLRGLQCVLALLAAMPGFGITIAINDPNTTLGTIGSPVLQAGYRPSSTATDVYLSPYDGVGGAGTTAVTANLGTFTQLKNALWNFTLTNTPGSNLTLTVTPGPGNSLAGTTLVWGTGGTPTLTAPDGVSYGPQARAYNSLELLLVTPQGNNAGTLSNLSFTTPDMMLTPGSAGFVNGSFTGSAPGALSPQWIISNGDLRQRQWTLSGQVALTAQGQNEGVAFRINGRLVESDIVAIPEPSSVFLFTAVIGGLAWRRRTDLSRMARKPEGPPV